MQSESDNTRDLELGRALKSALGPDDTARLEERLLEAYDQSFGLSTEDMWSVLTGWAWPGVAAAAAILLLALSTPLLPDFETTEPATIGRVLLEESANDQTHGLVTDPAPPEPDAILATAFPDQ